MSSLEDEMPEQNQPSAEELSYAEIYASAALNGEVVLTIPPEEVERVKIGLKNFKAKQV